MTALDGAAFAAGLGSTVVVAPHPDDESIGCGGLIALLRDAGVPVTVVLVSDGTGSHPHSERWPPASRHALRVGEMRAALDELGVRGDALAELGCRDGAVPRAGQDGFDAAVQALAALLQARQAASVLAPWRRDPHRDHRAASEMTRAALVRLPRPARLLEYGVWTQERGSAVDAPQVGETHAIRIDIGAAVARKLRAVAEHRSQQGGVIDDDPGGFCLPPAMLARCSEPFEVFHEMTRPCAARPAVRKALQPLVRQARSAAEMP